MEGYFKMASRYLFILTCLLGLMSGVACKERKKATTKTLVKKAIQQKKPIKKKQRRIKKQQRKTFDLVKDSITTGNAVAFFTQYGKANRETNVLIKTRLGNIKLKLYKNTPLHRASFIYLIKIGYFDRCCFHRVVPDFIIQGGDSEDGFVLKYRNALHNYRLPPEFGKNRPHKTGVIAAARDWENNPKKLSTPFQFYLIQGRDDYGHLDGEHTVFGEVVQGFSVLDKVAKEPLDNKEWPQIDIGFKMRCW